MTSPQPILITISGDLGSGKSTVGKLIAQRLGVPLKSTGAFQRELAQRLGLTTLQLNKLAESDRSIDTQIDAISAEIERRQDSTVVDSRMAWHFIPSAFKVFLSVDARLAAQRIFDAPRSSETPYANVEEVLQANLARRASEVERFKTRYGVNIADHANFDLVVDTSSASPEAIANVVVAEFGHFHGLAPNPAKPQAKHIRA
jgi:CMP/dCMP kinase